MNRYLGRIACLWRRKHARGVRVPDDHRALLPDNHHVYECRRCGARWVRKARKVKAATNKEAKHG